MGLEGIGLGGLLILIADVYAIIKTLGSRATTGQKVFWTTRSIIFSQQNYAKGWRHACAGHRVFLKDI